MKQIDFKLRQKCGIYCIFNLVNGKRYIGSSVDIYNRWHEHIHNLKNGKSHNKHLQSAWDKYGEDNFLFEVLEFCTQNNQFEREQYYMDFMNPEYNFTPVVAANTNRIISEEQKLKISNTLKEKYRSGELIPKGRKDNNVYCIIYNIKTWKLEAECSTFREAADLLAVDRDTVSTSKLLGRIYKDRYIITTQKIDSVVDLKNYFYRNFIKAKTSEGNYLYTINNNGTIVYYRNYAECGRANNCSSYIVKNRAMNQQELPNGIKCFLANDYVQIKENAVPIEKSSELLSGNIGGNPIMENTEINSEIAKGSESSYSVESE